MHILDTGKQPPLPCPLLRSLSGGASFPITMLRLQWPP